MEEIRCVACNRMLAQGQYIKLIVKCTRCKTVNTFTERHRAPQSERPERLTLKVDHERFSKQTGHTG